MQRRGACGQHPPWNCIVCVNGEGSPRARPTQVGVLLPCPPAYVMKPSDRAAMMGGTPAVSCIARKAG